MSSPEAGSRLMVLRPLSGEETLDDRCRAAARQWARRARMMRDLTHGAGAAFVEVLQPNQYATSHPFGSAEREIALKPGSVFREPVLVGYPHLGSAAGDLRRMGVPVVDAVGVFDSETRQVFSDNCCHYNTFGNRLLADRILEELRPVLVDRSAGRPRS